MQGGLLGSGGAMFFEDTPFEVFLLLELFMEPALERDDRMDPATDSAPSLLARSEGMALTQLSSPPASATAAGVCNGSSV